MFLLRLPFDDGAAWGAQTRDAHRLDAWETARALWPQFVFGAASLALATIASPRLALWSAPLTFGYLAAFPFALASASPRLGAWLARIRLCAVPEERDPPAIIDALRQREQGSLVEVRERVAEPAYTLSRPVA